MTGRWRVLLPILAAAVIAFAGSYLTYRWVKQQTVAPTRTEEVEVVNVAVPRIDIPWGTKLTGNELEMAPFLVKSLPAGHFTDTKSLMGRVLISHLKRGELVLESDLAPTDVTAGGVSAVISPGKRAIAVKGDKVLGLSGLIQPGNRVDVIVTITDPETESEVTKIVLEDVPVLATNTKIVRDESGEAAPVDVYTLEVTPEEGEKLALANSQGKLQFALRNATDMEVVYTRGATIPRTLESFLTPAQQGRSPRQEAGQPAKPLVTRAAHEVQVIKGSTVSSVKF